MPSNKLCIICGSPITKVARYTCSKKCGYVVMRRKLIEKQKLKVKATDPAYGTFNPSKKKFLALKINYALGTFER